jgi:small subunit ribosomal protein S2
MSSPTTEKQSEKPKAAVNVADIIPDVVAMLEAGVHFGHEKSKRNPKMEQYIYMHRSRVAIIDLNHTRDGIVKAAAFASEVASRPHGDILFVGTKRQARSIVQKYAEAVKMPYITKRWLGGTLTNFSTIQKSIEKLDELKRTEDSKQTAKLTKKERAVRQKEIERLESVLEGMKSLRSLPAAVFVAGAHDERIAVREAVRMGIPVIGIADTNADPALLTCPIPANDDAIRSLELITRVVALAIAKAKGIEMSI